MIELTVDGGLTSLVGHMSYWEYPGIISRFKGRLSQLLSMCALSLSTGEKLCYKIMFQKLWHTGDALISIEIYHNPLAEK